MSVWPGDRYVLRIGFTVQTVARVEHGGVVWVAGGRSGYGELAQWWLRVYG